LIDRSQSDLLSGKVVSGTVHELAVVDVEHDREQLRLTALHLKIDKEKIFELKFVYKTKTCYKSLKEK
jgi:hypothetical protein